MVETKFLRDIKDTQRWPTLSIFYIPQKFRLHHRLAAQPLYCLSRVDPKERAECLRHLKRENHDDKPFFALYLRRRTQIPESRDGQYYTL